MTDHRDPIHLSVFADAFRDSPAPTIILSADGCVRFWNPAAERAFGWTADESIGKPLPFIPPGKTDEHRAMRKRDLEGEGFTNRHISRSRKDGTLVDLSVSTAPIRDAAGAVIGIISVYTDITAQKREEEMLRLRQREAEREIATLGDLTDQLHRQQALLRLVIDGVPGLVAYIDREFRYRFINRGYAEWFGPKAAGFVGKTIAECMGDTWFEGIQPYLRAALAGEQLRFERTVEHEGGPRHVSAVYEPDRAEDGSIRGVVVLIQDITEQRQAVEALRASEERFRRMVEISAEGIWILDPKGLTVFTNRRMADILGYTSGEMLGRDAVDFVHPEENARAIAGFRSRILGDTSPREYRCVRKDGATVWLDITAAPMRDDSGAVTGILAMCTDVTERKHADQQLRQTQKLESLGILAGGIAHDFNNLLVGIMGNASLALDTLTDLSAAHPMLRDVVSASERAAQLTRQLLAYAGRDQRAAAPVDLTSLVRELASLLGASIPKLVQLSLDLDGALPPVLADQAQLQQVVMNLVINAAEAIPENTPGVVRITTERRALRPDDYRLAIIPIETPAPEYVAVSVRDTGGGMDLATQSRIFDPFFTTKFDGRGLGLSAVLGIVRGHHGTVTLETAPGAGACFTVLLPAAPEAALAQPAAGAALTRGSGTVLVVDDEQMVREVARRALVHAGYQVVLADNGITAIRQLAAHPEVRAVVLDLAMPEMSGDTAAVELRALRPDLPILLSSGYAECDATRQFSATGFAAFLQKPYRVGDLLEKLGDVIGTTDSPE